MSLAGSVLHSTVEQEYGNTNPPSSAEWSGGKKAVLQAQMLAVGYGELLLSPNAAFVFCENKVSCPANFTTRSRTSKPLSSGYAMISQSCTFLRSQRQAASCSVSRHTLGCLWVSVCFQTIQIRSQNHSLSQRSNGNCWNCKYHCVRVPSKTTRSHKVTPTSRLVYDGSKAFKADVSETFQSQNKASRLSIQLTPFYHAYCSIYPVLLSRLPEGPALVDP